jgi:choline kinase
MKNVDNYQNYYEVAYDEIIRAGAHFKTVDITGLRWVEMDNLEDYQQAQAYFANTKP